MSWEQRNHDFSTAQTDAQVAYIEAEREVKRMQAENEKLREYVTKLETANLDVTARLADYIGQYDPTDALVAEAKAENAKLRELVRDLYMALWTCNQHTCKHGNDGCYTEDGNSGGRCTLHDRMYELGVEV